MAEPILARNLRDVGGLPTVDGHRIRRGVLYRSGRLTGPSEGLADLGIRTVIDLRSSAERVGGPVEADGIETRHLGDAFSLPAGGPAPEELEALLGEHGAAVLMQHLYAGLIATPALADIVASLVDGAPALVHCTAGKDRTGVVVALVLALVGVPRDAIVDDYLVSDLPEHRTEPEALSALVPEWSEWWDPLLEARRDYLDAAFSVIDAHGSVGDYANDVLGIGPEHVAALRRLLVEDA